MKAHRGWYLAGVIAGLLAMAAIAGVQSYTHIEGLALRVHEPLTDARLLPLSVDLLIIVASVAGAYYALTAAAGGAALARVLMYSAIGATVAANVGAGILANSAHGATLVVVAVLAYGWPAAAFVGAAELAIKMLKAAHQASEPNWRADGPGRHAGAEIATVDPRAADAAMLAAVEAFGKSVDAGYPYSARGLSTRFGINRRQAGDIVAAGGRASANGHGS